MSLDSGCDGSFIVTLFNMLLLHQTIDILSPSPQDIYNLKMSETTFVWS
jgi:hypothetical protein